MFICVASGKIKSLYELLWSYFRMHFLLYTATPPPQSPATCIVKPTRSSDIFCQHLKSLSSDTKTIWANQKPNAKEVTSKVFKIPESDLFLRNHSSQVKHTAS